MAKYTGPGERLQAAKVLTDQAELRELALYPFGYVKAEVGKNPHTSQEVLLLLVSTMKQPMEEEDFQVAAALMERMLLEPEVVAALCAALEPNLSRIEPRDTWGSWATWARPCWKALVSQVQVPMECLAPLLSPKVCPNHLRRLAASVTTRREVLELLASDPGGITSARARKKLQANLPLT